MNRSASSITERNKRSIRDIKRQRNSEENDVGDGGKGDDGERNHSRKQPPSNRGSDKAARYGLWFVGVVSILFLFFLFSVVFAKTTVTVNPKTADIAIDQTLTASNDPATEGVAFSPVSSSADIQLTATSSGSEYREERASGEITIYNEHSAEQIRLVPNTRFATADGNIYRTDQAVLVPGQSGGEAGTVTATVYADAAGSEYNTAANTEFSIPGFTGTEYESTVYATSASGMSGGVAGDVPVLASSTEAALEEEAATKLRQELMGNLTQDLPEGFFIYDDATFFSSEVTDSEDIASTTSQLTVTGELSAVAFDAGRLSSYAANAYSADVPADANVNIQNLDEFEFAFADKASFTPGEDQTFEFTLNGDSTIVWQHDQRALVRDLRGMQKDQLNEVLENYPGIQSAQIETRPFWKQTLPSDAAEIGVNTLIK